MLKRFLALLLAITLVVSCLPVGVWAEGEATQVSDTAALKAAVAVGGEIKLTSSFELTAKVTVPAGKTVVLDLNGQTIESKNAKDYFINNEGNLTVLDSAGNGGIAGTNSASGTGYAIYNKGNLTIEGGKFTSKSTNRSAVAVGSEGTLTINGGTFEAVYDKANGAYSVYTLGLGGTGFTTTINGGTFIAESNADNNGARCAVLATVSSSNNTQIIVNGGNFISTRTAGTFGASVLKNEKTTAQMTINGGTFDVKENGTGGMFDNMGTVTVVGGTFKYDSSVIAREKTSGYTPGTTVVTGGTFLKQDGTKNEIDSKYIASGSTQDNSGFVAKNVSSSDELVAAMATSGAIRLTGDIALTAKASVPAGKTVVLDLNGKTISTNNGQTVRIENAGNLTIVDSREGDKDGEIVATPATESETVYPVKNTGVLTINGGKFTASTKAKTVYAVYSAAPSVTINGGTFTATYTGGAGTWGSAYAVYLDGDGSSDATATINGGTFKTESTNPENSRSTPVFAKGDNKINVIVNNGTFEGYRNGYRGASAMRLGSEKVAVVVNGGTFTAGRTASGYTDDRMFDGTAGTLTITGGTFKYDGKIFTDERKATITGGTFVKWDGTKNEIASKNFANTGYEQAADGSVVEKGTAPVVPDHKHDLDNCNEHDADVKFLPWDKTTTLPESGDYYLTADVNLSKVHEPTGNLNLCLNGKTITAPSNERSFALAAGLTLSITDHDNTGKITDGVRNYGGVINVNAGATFNLYGGQLTGNKTKDNNGNGQSGAVYLSAAKDSLLGGVFNMYGGVISGNTGFNGGAIYAGKDTTFTMTGGTISGNTAKNSGGAIMLGTDATFVMSGGEIINNNSAVEGGAITVTNSPVTLSGTAVIKDNKADGKTSNVYLKTGVVTVGAMDASANVGVGVATPVDGMAVSAALGSAAVSGNFSSDNDAYEIIVKNDTLCLNLKSDHIHDVDNCNEHDADVKFLPWDGTGTIVNGSIVLPAGNYYLTDNVVLTNVVAPSGDVNICLNGKTITAPSNERSFALAAGLTLSITDHDNTGKITGGVRNWGAVINVNAGATFNLYGGQLTGNKTKESNGNGQGGAVYLTGADTNAAVFNMYGGVISGNTGYNGGAIYAGKNTTFTMTGGTISGNTALNAGGAIWAGTNASVNLSGNVVFNGNNSYDVYLNDTVITLGAMDPKPQISVNVKDPADGLAISAALNSVNVDGIFSSYDVKYEIVVKNDTLCLDAKSDHFHNVDNCDKHDADVKFLPWDDTTKLPKSGNYYLTADVNLTAVHEPTGNLNLCLNGKTIKAPANERSFALKAGLTLSITDHDNTGKITGGVRNWGGVINVNAGATFNLYGGSLTDNRSKDTEGGDGQGGAVYLSKAENDLPGGVFNMYGGEITDNQANMGGAVYVLRDATFNMYGGKISGNEVVGGGAAVYLSNGTLNLAGGEISGHTAKTAIQTAGKSTINMTGGKVNNNVAGSGGAIRLEGAGTKMVLSGGEISGNSGSYGGAIYASVGTIFEMSGGVFENNTASQVGGAIRLQNATATISGGEIKNNTSVSGGGAINVAEKSTLTITGGTISGNTSKQGGAINVTDQSAVNLVGGLISKNTSTGAGGAIFLSGTDTKMTMSGGEISGNTGSYGGAIYAAIRTNLEMTGGAIEGNTASKSGGAMLLQRAVATLAGGEIKSNTAGTTGGGVEIQGATVTLTGTKITGNAAVKGAGMYIADNGEEYQPSVTLAGGQITGNTASDVGGGVTTMNAKFTKLELSGDVVIEGNKAGDKVSNLYLPDGAVFTVGEMGANAKVGISAKRVYGAMSAKTQKDCTASFFSDNSALAVVYQGNAVYLQAVDGHVHCLCSDKSAVCKDHGTIVFAPWSDPKSLPATAGNYYLTVDVQLSAVRDVSNNINLCLNGHKITAAANERTFALNAGYTLSIADCTDKGMITGGVRNWGGVINVNAGATFNLYGGNLTGNRTKDAEGGDGQGGAVYLSKAENDLPGGVFNMYGGQISKNEAYRGGAVYLMKGSEFNLYGGAITENKAINRSGAIFANGTATINIFGGEITKNTGASSGGAISVTGKSVLTMTGGKIADNIGTSGGAIILEGTGTKMVLTGGEISGNSGTYGGAMYASVGTVFEMTGGVFANNTASQVGGAMRLQKATATISGGEFKNNSAVTGGGALNVAEQSTLTVTGGTISGNTAKQGGAIYVSNQSVFNLVDGVISGNSGGSGGTILLVNTNTKMTMSGGEISDSEGSYGGAIYAAVGTIFEMSGGVFANNTASQVGGAIRLQKATATISGGEFKNNSAVTGGGAFNVAEKSTLTITGGTISGNTAKQGGAINVSNQSTFNLVDGVISKNTSTGAGGAIILLNTGTKMTMSGGEITNNTGSTGGGIFVSTRTNFEMTGGKITYNTVKKHGGGIALLMSTATIRGGTISYNKGTDRDAQGAGIKLDGATLNIYNCNMYGNALLDRLNSGGAAIAAYKSVVTSNGATTTHYSKINMYGGTISNHTGRSGGAIQILTETVFNMYGGTIRNCEATNDGGAAAVYSKASFNVYGGVFENNKSGKAGGALYYGKGCTGVLEDVTATGNSCGNDGGFLHAYGDTTKITMKDMKLYGNESGKNGGAIAMMMQSELHMDNSDLYENTGLRGGAIYLAHKIAAYVDNTKIYKNNSVEYGGGVSIDVGNFVVFTNVKILDNKAGTNGGGVLTRGDVRFKDCLIDGNTAAENGGGIATLGAWTYDHTITNGYVDRGQGMILENTVVSNNSCVGIGGGAFLKEKSWNTILDSTFTGNTSGEQGSALFIMDDLEVHGMTVTGNTSKNDGFAVWYDVNKYDGMGYVHGIFKMGGNVVVKDNQGGDMMLCEDVNITNVSEGYGKDTYFNVTLSDGVLTNRILGAYNYEGGDLNYTVTYGDRSYTEPEVDTALFETEEEEPKSDVWLYAGVGIFVVAVIAVVALVAMKKKKAGKPAEMPQE